MTNPIQGNVHIKQDGIHAFYPDEAEIFSMQKNMYKDYWRVKADGQPIEESVEGNNWIIEYRINRLGGGEPNINKEIYFRRDRDGQRVRVSDTVDENREGSIGWALERTRTYTEKAAFLASAYEAHERYSGDIQRLIDATQQIDISLHDGTTMGRLGRQTMARWIPDINDRKMDVEIVNWQINSDFESESVSRTEFDQAKRNGEEFILPPSDSGSPRKETITYEEPLVFTREGNQPTSSNVQRTSNGTIKWGDEPNRTV